MIIDFRKYQAIEKIYIPRKWPDAEIKRMPRVCSVDLRDGNQSLINPMNLEKKLYMFNCLVSIGFKEIEVGFPSASKTDYNFIRYLIENELVPDDVIIQVLVPARKELIEKTIKSLSGIKKAIIQLYNPTSKQQREQVLNNSKSETIELALSGVSWILSAMKNCQNNKFILQYAPESFTATELDFSLEICNAVSDRWLNETGRDLIINLPSTVELTTPNIFADQIEWMSNNLNNRQQICLSIHPHNDRGTATASAELATLAGADRVEGTLFGNGERTGNLDIINFALNCTINGIDSGLKLSNLPEIVKCAEVCNEIPISPRHPYAGELVYTAFSGSHQDAIKKSLKLQKNKYFWDVPYLPIDPKDIGRSYDSIIRINGQSGKGGLAYILDHNFGFCPPRNILVYFQQSVQRVADVNNKELTELEIITIFENKLTRKEGPISCEDLQSYLLNNNEIVIDILFYAQKRIISCDRRFILDNLIKFVNENLNIVTKVISVFNNINHITNDTNYYISANFNGFLIHALGIGENLEEALIDAFFSLINIYVDDVYIEKYDKVL